MEEYVFQYKSDWVNNFESYLKENIDRTNFSSIKTLIIESNQSVQKLCDQFKYNEKIKLDLINSKEKEFYNCKITQIADQKEFYVYVDTENPRFWFVHYKNSEDAIGRLLLNIFCNQLYQDSIYLSTEQMKDLRVSQDQSIARTMSIKFEPKLSNKYRELIINNNKLINKPVENDFENLEIEDLMDIEEEELTEIEEEELTEIEEEELTEIEEEELTEIEEEELTEIEEGVIKKHKEANRSSKSVSSMINQKTSEELFGESSNLREYGISMRLWTLNNKSLEKIYLAFEKGDLPFIIKSSGFTILDEFKNVEMIEDFSYHGRCILSKGKNFFKHLDFVKQIRESYERKMEIIESYSFDSSAARTDLFEMRYGQEIDRKKLIPMIQALKAEFKVYLVKLFDEVLYDYYKVIDLHTGQRLYMQVFDDRMYLNLPKSVCGNNILRLKENLVRKFDDKIQLIIANQKIN